MKMLSIAYYHLVSNFRDKKELMLVIVSPILLIFILGNALGGTMDQEPFQLSLGIYYEEASGVSQGLDHYLGQASKAMDLSTLAYDSLDDLKDKIIDGDVDAGIVVYGDQTVEVLGAPNRTIASNVGLKLVENFDAYLVTQSIQEEENIDILEGKTYGVKENFVDFEGRSPTATDYYAITMLAMFMMYGAAYGAYAIRSNYLEIRGQRIRVSTVKFYQHFIGLALGTVATISLSGLTVVYFAKYAFGAHYGDNMAFVIFVVVSFAIFSAGFGMVVAVAFKDRNKGSNIINVLIPVFTLISGGFVALPAQGLIGQLQNFTPNHHLHQILIHYAFKTSHEAVVTSLITLWIMIVLAYSGAIVLKGREV